MATSAWARNACIRASTAAGHGAIAFKTHLGCEIETDIFIGVVYYQRLRHLVMDKAQVRARGKVDRMTNQPVKGRKNKGGIRSEPFKSY